MKIALLVYVEDPSRPEFDVSIDQIADALQSRGHTTTKLPVRDDVLGLIGGISEGGFDLVFNLLEQFGRGNLGLVEATGVLELLETPYTGSGPGELFLQQDKALTKKLLAYEKVNCPDFAVFSPQADLETGGNLRMPLFVKPLRMDASFGIDARSLVHNTGELMNRVAKIHAQFGDAALCEQFIDGREFYVGLLGNQEPIAFPPIEIDFSRMPEGSPHVMGASAKFDESSAEYKGSQPVVASLPSETRARLQQVALASYRALRLRDYARVDLRLTESGDIYVIEVNANCYLERGSEYAMGAAAAGIEFNDLIQRIVELAMERNGKLTAAKTHGGQLLAPTAPA